MRGSVTVCPAADRAALPARPGWVPSIVELATGLAAAPRGLAARVSALATRGIACVGDGTSGNRVQAVYAYTAGHNRSTAVLPLIRRYAAQVDAVFRASAAALGGSRRVRWVTSSGCALSIVRVKVSSTARTSFARLERDLAAAGLKRPDRKYLVWFDAPMPRRVCGVGDEVYDASRQPTNGSNSGPSFAWVYAPCWGQSARSGPSGHEFSEAHELMHTLGAVQTHAPHATPAGHCRDEWDLMCYADGTLSMRHVCSSGGKNRFDCRGDDYFNPKPRPGSWLATHWNTASSSFLLGSDTGPPTIAIAATFNTGGRPPSAGLTWTVRDDQLLLAIELQEQVDGGAWTSASTYRINPSDNDVPTWYDAPGLVAGRVYAWRIRAMDSAGQWSAWATAQLDVP